MNWKMKSISPLLQNSQSKCHLNKLYALSHACSSYLSFQPRLEEEHPLELLGGSENSRLFSQINYFPNSPNFKIILPPKLFPLVSSTGACGTKVEAKTDFFHSSPQESKKSIIFQHFLIPPDPVFDSRKKMTWRTPKTKTSAEKLRVCTRINSPPTNFIPGIVDPSRFHFFSKSIHKSVIIFLDDFFFVGRISIFLFPFSFHDLFSHTKTHAHSHTQSANYQHWHRISNHQSSPQKKLNYSQFSPALWMVINIHPMFCRLRPRRVPSRIAHFSRFLEKQTHLSCHYDIFSAERVRGFKPELPPV